MAFITVQGTVKDSNGNIYQNGSGRAVLVSGNGIPSQWTTNTNQTVQDVVPVIILDSFGTFALQLQSTASIDQQTSSPQWQFSFNSNENLTGTFIGFTMTPMALTTSQDITATIQAQAAPLTFAGPFNAVLKNPGAVSQTVTQPTGTLLFVNGQFDVGDVAAPVQQLYGNSSALVDNIAVRRTVNALASSGFYNGIRSELIAAGGVFNTVSQPVYSSVNAAVKMQGNGQAAPFFAYVNGLGVGNILPFSAVVTCFAGGTVAGGNAATICTGFGETDIAQGNPFGLGDGLSIFHATVNGTQVQGATVIPFSNPVGSSVLGNRPLMNLTRKTTAGTVTGISGTTLTFNAGTSPFWDAAAATADGQGAGVHCNPIGQYIKLGSTQDLYGGVATGDDVTFDSLNVGHWYKVTDIVSSNQLTIETAFDQTNLTVGAAVPSVYMLVQGGQVQGFSSSSITLPANGYIWQNGDTIVSAPYHLSPISGIDISIWKQFKSGGGAAVANGITLASAGPYPIDNGLFLGATAVGYHKGIFLNYTPPSDGIGIDLSGASFANAVAGIKMPTDRNAVWWSNANVYEFAANVGGYLGPALRSTNSQPDFAVFNQFTDAANYAAVQVIAEASYSAINQVKAGSGAAHPLYFFNTSGGNIVFGTTGLADSTRFNPTTGAFDTGLAGSSPHLGTTGPLQPASAGGTTVGTAALPFSSVYVGAAGTNNIQVTGTATGARVFTLPDANSNPVVPDAGAANNFLTGISSAGVITKAQPAFSNLSGSIAIGQTPLTTRGDILVADSAPSLSRLAVGATGTVLIGGTDPSYSATPTVTSIQTGAGSAGVSMALQLNAATTGFYVAGGLVKGEVGAADSFAFSGTQVFAKQLVLDLANADINIARSAANTMTLTASSGVLTSAALQVGTTVSKYNAINTVANGIPSEYAQINTTGLTGNVTAATLYAVPASGAGLYRVSAYVVLTTAGSISSTLPNVQLVYTDIDANTSVTLDASPILGAAGLGQTGLLTANTVGTVASGVVVINAKASTTIQYQTVNYASNAAGMTYALHIRLEAL